MRSLQDWLRYVEEQSELARKKKEASETRREGGEKHQILPGESAIPSFHTSHPSAKVEAPITWRLTAPITEEEAQALREEKTEVALPSSFDGKQRVLSPQQVSVQNRGTSTKEASPSSSPPEGEPSAQELLDHLPRHLQILARTSLQEEKAQKYYKKPFRESREDLIRRLLDPELSLEETARILGVCPTTVRRYTNRGWLKHHRTIGNQRRFRLSDVLEFLERQGKLERE